MEQRIKLFWNWFLEKQDEFLTMHELPEERQEQLLSDFQDKLETCAEGLTFDMSPLSDSGREIVFSADNDESLFECVEKIVELSPELDWWEFVAFRQPIGDEISVNFNGEKFETEKMYFLPLESEESPDSIAVRIAIPNYRPNDEDQEIGVYLTLEAQVGEYDITQYLDYMELCPIPLNLEEDGYLSLVQFPAFLDSFKKEE